MPNPSQKVTTNVQTILHDIGYNRPTTVYESTYSQGVKSTLGNWLIKFDFVFS